MSRVACVVRVLHLSLPTALECRCTLPNSRYAYAWNVTELRSALMSRKTICPTHDLTFQNLLSIYPSRIQSLLLPRTHSFSPSAHASDIIPKRSVGWREPLSKSVDGRRASQLSRIDALVIADIPKSGILPCNPLAAVPRRFALLNARYRKSSFVADVIPSPPSSEGHFCVTCERGGGQRSFARLVELHRTLQIKYSTSVIRGTAIFLRLYYGYGSIPNPSGFHRIESVKLDHLHLHRSNVYINGQ